MSEQNLSETPEAATDVAPRWSRMLSTPTGFTPSAGQNLRALFCHRTHVAPTQADAVVLSRALPWHARLFRPLLKRFRPQHFAPDEEFVARALDLHHLRHLAAEAQDFRIHPANRTFSRRVLRLRISTLRLSRLLSSAIHAPEVK